jgi:TrmH family RNA methyltransferase
VLAKITGVTRLEGIIAEVKLPEEQPNPAAKRLLVCDEVSDPGNLGTLLRSALAFGWDGACLIGGVDPFNDKVLRASRGALFTLPYWQCSWSEFPRDMPLFAADMAGIPIHQITVPERLALIMSHEGAGVSPTVKERASLVSIPMAGPMESLNVAVAGGIALYLWKPSIK